MRSFLFRLALLCCWLVGVFGLASDLLNDKICGTTMGGRIVNGTESQEEELPWVVHVTLPNPTGGFTCGGSLITSRHVLSAAHCVPENMFHEVTVRYGATKFPEGSKVAVKALIRHKKYKRGSSLGDIMVLLLAEDLQFTQKVRPICLPTPRLNPRQMAGMKVTVAGWGAHYEPGEEAKHPNLDRWTDKLMKTSPTLLNDTRCYDLDKSYKETEQICTLGDEGNDSCQGDSGGPLFVRVNSTRYYQIGLVSGGIDCLGEAPGICTNVYHYVQWIMRVVNVLG